MFEEDGKTYYDPDEWRKLPIEERHEIEKNQLFAHLTEAGIEAAEFFLERVEGGQIEGSSYWSNAEGCGCVLGTLKFATHGENGAEGTDTGHWDSTFAYSNTDDWENPNLSVVEVLAYNLSPGDTPENNENARLLRDWTKEWLEANKVSA